MRILVTGSSGFVGRNLVKYLSRECGHLCGLFDLSDGLDITDRDTIYRFFDRFEPQIVYHLAAQINPKRSEENRELDWRVNVQGTLNIIDAMIEHNVNVLVFTSSDAVVNPVSNYGVTKRTAEEYILKYTRQNKIQGKIARFSSVYGYGRKGGAVNIFLNQGINGKNITPFLNSFSHLRDYTYVTDVCKALEIVQRDGEIGGIYNVGTGVKHSTIDVATLVSLLTGSEIRFLKNDISAVGGSDFDVTPLHKLGFVPEYDLYKGMKAIYHMMAYSYTI
jgi:nucleoside-diphosphate-sugar epimerase